MIPIRVARIYATIAALGDDADADVVDGAHWAVPADSWVVGVFFDAGIPPLSLVAAEVSRVAIHRLDGASIYGITFTSGTAALPGVHARKRWNVLQGMLGVVFPPGAGLKMSEGERLYLNYSVRNYSTAWVEDGYVTAYIYHTRVADAAEAEARERTNVQDVALDDAGVRRRRDTVDDWPPWPDVGPLDIGRHRSHWRLS